MTEETEYQKYVKENGIKLSKEEFIIDMTKRYKDLIKELGKELYLRWKNKSSSTNL